MTHLEVPAQFQRNSPRVLALGVEHTGALLLERGNALLGWPDLSGRDVLDIGCGSRFTQTIINRGLAVGSYTGIDVDGPLIGYLSSHVGDSRFAFHRWDVHNVMYNPGGAPLTSSTRLPIADGRTFDLTWMYSVVTHTYPHDAASLFRICRRHVKPGGALVFSAFIDNGIESFDDRVKDQPLLMAFYNEAFLAQIVADAGWRIDVRFNGWSEVVMQDLFVCRPVPSANRSWKVGEGGRDARLPSPGG